MPLKDAISLNQFKSLALLSRLYNNRLQPSTIHSRLRLLHLGLYGCIRPKDLARHRPHSSTKSFSNIGPSKDGSELMEGDLSLYSSLCRFANHERSSESPLTRRDKLGGLAVYPVAKHASLFSEDKPLRAYLRPLWQAGI